jgi:phospholipid transport system transporter-binding protein
MSEVGIEDLDNGGVRLVGALVFATVPGLYRRRPVLAAGNVDLSGVARSDSAGLALLLEWQRRARGGLRFSGIPSQLADLIRVSGLSASFGLAGR